MASLKKSPFLKLEPGLTSSKEGRVSRSCPVVLKKVAEIRWNR